MRLFRSSFAFAGFLLSMTVTAAELPEPPQQHAPWVASAAPNLPDKFADIVRIIFMQGFADPRGLEYHECTQNSIHGWVLPAKPGDSQRYIVAWNGLVYPVQSVGAKADLKADLEAAMKVVQERIEQAKRDGSLMFYGRWGRMDHLESASYLNLQLLQVPLLLRLNETALAERVWALENVNRTGAISAQDAYQRFVFDWVRAQHQRSIDAWLKGDEPLARVTARALMKSAESIELELRTRNVKVEDHRGENSENRKFKYLDEIDSFELFTNQLEQRALHPRGDHEIREMLGRQDAHERLKAKWPETAARIAVLIENLDIATGYQMSNPGGITYDGSPVVQAISREGHDAVEPLIQCLENDKRVIVSYYFGHGEDPHWIVESTKEVAVQTLGRILHADSSTENLPYYVQGDGKAEAATYRKFWASIKGVQAEERWFRQLADDGAADKWHDAHYNLKKFNTGTDGWNVTYPESLRKRTAPTFTELMFKRMRSEIDKGNFEYANDYADGIGDWEPARALEPLKELSKAIDAKIEMLDTDHLEAAERVIRWRLRRGDTSALDDYASWVTRAPAPTDRFRDDLERWYRPLWEHADYAPIAAAAEKVFGPEHKPWTKRAEIWQLSKSWLLGVDAFRAMLVRELGNRNEAGKCDPKQVAYLWHLDPLAPAGDGVVSYRVCDEVASYVSWVDGSPRCELYWAEKDRDEAVKQCIDFLKTHGHLFRYRPQPAKTDGSKSKWPMATAIDHEHNEAFPLFTPLDKPATADDVAAQRSIFALDETLPRRAIALPSYPLKTHWLKCPYEAKEVPNRNYWFKRTHEGFVWQLEEVQKDGQWKRFAGYAGAHEILRLPAEELECILPASGQLPEGINVSLTPPGAIVRAEGGYQVPKELIIGSALAMKLVVSNRRLLDTEVFCHWRPGYELKVSRMQGEKPHHLDHGEYSPNLTELDKYTWLPIQSRQPLPQTTAQPRLLKPAEEATMLDLDMKDYFEITEPGIYRITLSFSESLRGDADTRGKAVDAIFNVWEK